MKKFSLTFATATILALGTFAFLFVLAGSPASVSGVPPQAPSASVATDVVRSSLPSHSSAAGKMGLVENYGRLPLSFEANHGQTDPQVKFLSRGHGYSLFLTAGEAVLTLRSASRKSKSGSSATSPAERDCGFSGIAGAGGALQSSIINRQSSIGNRIPSP